MNKIQLGETEDNDPELISKINTLERVVTVSNVLLAKIEQENNITLSGKTIPQRLTQAEQLYKINNERDLPILSRLERIINHRK